MQVRICAIGRMKQGPEAELYQEYIKRIPWKVELKELELRGTPKNRRAEETSQLLAACKGVARIIALDEQGEALTSERLAQTIGEWQQQGDSSLAIIIGGSDGLDRAQLKEADLVLSFGRLTWPHMLVRAMLAEQCYRIYTLLNNHPYHRV